MSEVKLTGQADLEAIYKALKKITDDAQAATKQVETLGVRTQDGLDKVTKRTENNIKKTGGLLRRLASSLYSDFKALTALQAVIGGMKLSNQFAGSLKESVKLSDTVRRLGNAFGVARADFGRFHSALARGLGDIGLSSEAAANALEGMAGFGVRGIEAAKGLAIGAGTLAGIGGERGNEKSVAGGLAAAIQATGKDVNDLKAQQEMVGEISAAVTTTGKTASEILSTMNDLFSKMPDNLRKKIGAKGAAQLSMLSTIGGPGLTAAFKEYLGKDKIGRMAMEAQGFKPFDKKGQLDLPGLLKFIDATKSRGLGARESLQTAGFSDEAAEGLVRVAEKADVLKDSLSRLETASRDNLKAFNDSLGMMDAFRGSINTVKGRLEELFAGAGQKITDVLAGAVGNKSAALVVGGGALIASKLVGSGLRGLSEKVLGKNMLGKTVGGLANEAITGQADNTQRVFLTNPEDIAKFMAAGSTGMGGGKIGGALEKGAKLAAAGAIGYEVGSQIVNPALDKFTQGKTEEGFEGNAVERLIFKMDQLLGGSQSAAITSANQKVKVEVQTKEPNLRPVNRISSPPSN